jgi:lysophospholipase L1-like esterase
MFKHNMLMALACALVLSACGGGGGDSSAPPTAAPTPPASAPVAPTAPKTVLVEMYGDSTTCGSPTGECEGQLVPDSEPADLQTMLQHQFGPNVTVSNQGVPGTTAAELLGGGDGKHPNWPAQMAQSKAQVISLNYGINDAVANTSTADFYATMYQLVQIAQQAGKTVVLLTSNPIDKPVNAQLDQLVQQEKLVSSSLSVPIVDDYTFMSVMDNWPSFLVDGVHPTAEGYNLKATHEFPVISLLVNNLLQ